MDWFKVEARIATNPKVHELTHHGFRVLVYLWGHSTMHETGGHIPKSAASLIPYANAKTLRELEARGFIRTTRDGWVLHDWEEHQAEALAVHRKRRADRERLRQQREAAKRGEV